MKKSLFITIFISYCISEGYNMQLLSNISFNQTCNDITGFYQDEREFAVIGLQSGAAIVDITDPYNPFQIEIIEGSSSTWRDLKYWDRHVYIGTEAEDGVKIVSVDNLDEPVLVNTVFDFVSSHNIYIDSDGYLYVVGADDNDIWIYDLEDPANPNLIGTWNLENETSSQAGYCHDIEVYNNKLYCASIYVGYFRIIDVSDKANPITILSHFTGTDGISTHDVAISEDENYLFTGDENLGGHIKAWDISDYNNINLIDEYQTENGEEHTSHNIYIKPGTNQLYVSYYADGTRIIDISNPYQLEEIAYYDFSDTEGLYVSNWGVYPYLPSGNIISSDRELGLFVLSVGGISIIHDDVQDVSLDDSPYVPFVAYVDSFEGNIENVTLHYSLDNINWNDVSMYNNMDNRYEAIMTFDQSSVIVYYYITATNSIGQSSQYPQIEESVSFIYGDLIDIIFQDFEESNNWTVESTASVGEWEWGVPIGTSLQGGFANVDFIVQTNEDYSENGEKCFVTGNYDVSQPGGGDVDGGETVLYSETYNLEQYPDVLLSYWRWYTNDLGNNPGSDIWNVQASSDGGVSWVDLEYTSISMNQWYERRFVLSDYIDLSNEVQFRYIASDLLNAGDVGSGGSLVEAALDDFKLEIINIQAQFGDINYDGSIDVLDAIIAVSIVLGEYLPSNEQFENLDFNNDQLITVQDIVNLVNIIIEN
jgi:choice-of-anchor B domain-containing protein